MHCCAHSHMHIEHCMHLGAFNTTKLHLKFEAKCLHKISCTSVSCYPSMYLKFSLTHPLIHSFTISHAFFVFITFIEMYCCIRIPNLIPLWFYCISFHSFRVRDCVCFQKILYILHALGHSSSRVCSSRNFRFMLFDSLYNLQLSRSSFMQCPIILYIFTEMNVHTNLTFSKR